METVLSFIDWVNSLGTTGRGLVYVAIMFIMFTLWTIFIKELSSFFGNHSSKPHKNKCYHNWISTHHMPNIFGYVEKCTTYTCTEYKKVESCDKSGAGHNRTPCCSKRSNDQHLCIYK